MSFGKGTEFEFRRRRWFMVGIFAVGFGCFEIDRMNAGQALVILIKGGGLRTHTPVSRAEIQAIFLVGAALVAAGTALRTWGTSYLSAAVMQDSRIHSDRLVADGPYRYARNPLYFGTLVMGVGLGLYASRLGWFVIVIGILIFHSRLIRREEAELEQAQGESFRAYCRSVHRFWPSLWPRLPSSGRKPHLAQAFAGELFLWGVALASFIFAVSLKVVTWEIVLPIFFVIRVVQLRPKKPAPAQTATPHGVVFLLFALLGLAVSQARAASRDWLPSAAVA
ncbi:MAG: methyltransferase family protein, partial [Terriglobia bacterium]